MSTLQTKKIKAPIDYRGEGGSMKKIFLFFIFFIFSTGPVLAQWELPSIFWEFRGKGFKFSSHSLQLWGRSHGVYANRHFGRVCIYPGGQRVCLQERFPRPAPPPAPTPRRSASYYQQGQPARYVSPPPPAPAPAPRRSTPRYRGQLMGRTSSSYPSAPRYQGQPMRYVSPSPPRRR